MISRFLAYSIGSLFALVIMTVITSIAIEGDNPQGGLIIAFTVAFVLIIIGAVILRLGGLI